MGNYFFIFTRPGLPGPDGFAGTPGTDGCNGTDGRDGVPGIPGVPGKTFIKVFLKQFSNRSVLILELINMYRFKGIGRTKWCGWPTWRCWRGWNQF